MLYFRKSIVFFLFFLLAFTSCQKKEYSDAQFFLGTSIYIRIIQGGSEDLIKAVFEKIHAIEKMMSTSKDDYSSTVLLDINAQSMNALRSAGTANIDYSNPNHIKHYSLPLELATVIRRGVQIAQQTEGAFDPTIAGLVELWGFGTQNFGVPTENSIAELLPRINWKTLAVSEDGELSMGIGQSIDVGGIAKGYAADIAKDFLQENGVEAAILDFGGNIVVFGNKNEKDSWKIGIQKPYEPGAIVLALEVKEASVVTSGVYERYFEVEGKEYFHILDAKTGYPADNELLSVSVLHSESITADALATGIFVMGLEKGMRFIEEREDVEGILLTREKKIFVSSGLKKAIKLIAADFSLME